MHRLAVLGHPINHSKSPLIHQAFAQQQGIALTYEALDVLPGHFEQQVGHLMAQGYWGCNVTLPHKEAAFALAQHRTPRAQSAGAVNTLIFKQGEVWGDNTDGVGLMWDIQQRLGFSLADKRILVLGAGGAVRGILQPLLALQPASVLLVNRTVSKAQALADLWPGQIQAGSWQDVQGVFDLVINGTSASVTGELPPLDSACLAPHTLVVDMMYASQPTAFLRWAGQQTPLVHDGLGMLVAQAAFAFEDWFGVMPDIAPVYRQLSAQIHQH